MLLTYFQRLLPDTCYVNPRISHRYVADICDSPYSPNYAVIILAVSLSTISRHFLSILQSIS